MMFRPVIRWHLREVLRAKGWTPYRLAKEAGIGVPVAYRLSHNPQADRIEASTLEAICVALNVSPGDLLVIDHSKVTKARRSD